MNTRSLLERPAPFAAPLAAQVCRCCASTSTCAALPDPSDSTSGCSPARQSLAQSDNRPRPQCRPAGWRRKVETKSTETKAIELIDRGIRTDMISSFPVRTVQMSSPNSLAMRCKFDKLAVIADRLRIDCDAPNGRQFVRLLRGAALGPLAGIDRHGTRRCRHIAPSLQSRQELSVPSIDVVVAEIRK